MPIEATNTRVRSCLPLVVLAAVITCASPEANRDDSASESVAPVVDSAPAVTGATATTPSLEIYIDSVSVGNPLVVTGRARTFENTVQIRVRDVRGDVIAGTHTTSTGEMGHHNPYEARLWLVRHPGAQVIVDAFEYSAKDGSERSLTSDTVAYSVVTMPVTLLFSTDCEQTKAFTRDVPRGVAVARLMAEALVAGPNSAEKAAGATSPFPAGSAVNSVVLTGGELTVDFNERLQNVGGACAAQAIRTSVTRTLERLPSVRRVVISAGGSRELALQP